MEVEPGLVDAGRGRVRVLQLQLNDGGHHEGQAHQGAAGDDLHDIIGSLVYEHCTMYTVL